jgi:hypothetical protein
MGAEVVFVLIYPIALICIVTAALSWFGVAKVNQTTVGGRAIAYLPLIAGFAVSMGGVAIFAYINASSDFTWLVRQGYFTEAQRPLYLPRRIVGQAILSLVLVLPFICLLVTPITAKFVRADRLSLLRIGLWLAIGWLALSFMGWILSFGITPPYSLADLLGSTAVPMLIYGLPIPLAALFFFRGDRRLQDKVVSDGSTAHPPAGASHNSTGLPSGS